MNTVLLWVVLAAAPQAVETSANAGRMLTTDTAEKLGGVVVGLQRTAVAFDLGGIELAVDTSVLADVALLPNVGVRAAVAFGPHQVAIGARYAHFVGTAIYSQIVHSQEPQVVRFEPQMSGPAAYAVYGIDGGRFRGHLEARYSSYGFSALSFTAGFGFALTYDDEAELQEGAWHYTYYRRWSIVAELGFRAIAPAGTPPVRAVVGLQFTGPNLGVTAGIAYVGLSDPLFPQLPVLPVVDLSWTF